MTEGDVKTSSIPYCSKCIRIDKKSSPYLKKNSLKTINYKKEFNLLKNCKKT